MIKGRNITITTTDSFDASKQACKVERERGEFYAEKEMQVEWE